MGKLNDDDIIRFLQKSKNPMGPSEIAEKFKEEKKLKIERNAIHYHLKNLEKNGKIIRKDGKYSINKPDFEKLKEIEEKIIQLLSIEEYSPIDIQQKLGFDEIEIWSALYHLEIEGLIKEGLTNSISQKWKLIKYRRTTQNQKESRNIKYTLTYIAYSKIGICPVCKDKLKSDEMILTAFFRTNYGLKLQAWKKVLIHLSCLPNSAAYNTIYGKQEEMIFCDYCGLPLSPKMLPQKSITYKLMRDHFYEIELETIRLLEQLILSWTIRSDMPVMLDDISKFSICPHDSTIETVYKNSNMDIPNWISDRFKSNNNNLETDSAEGENLERCISLDISSELILLDQLDLSELNVAEQFIKVLIKYRSDAPEDYDINSRTKDIWTAAKRLKKKYEMNITKMYEALLGPAASIHTYLGEAFGTEQYDFDRQMTYAPYDESSIFSQTIAFKHNNKFYHPFCADRLGLKK